MISLDTNVLVRLLVEDDEDQVARARALLRQSVEANDRCLVTLVVLCELQWVLKRLYKVPREELATVVESFLIDDRYAVEEPDAVRVAAIRYRNGKADLADYLVGIRSRALGADRTFTFDRALRGEEDLAVL